MASYLRLFQHKTARNTQGITLGHFGGSKGPRFVHILHSVKLFEHHLFLLLLFHSLESVRFLLFFFSDLFLFFSFLNWLLQSSPLLSPFAVPATRPVPCYCLPTASAVSVAVWAD